MTEIQSIVDAMTVLTDDEVRTVVAAATTGRPALAVLHAAALEIRVVPAPIVPPPPTIVDAHVVPDPRAATDAAPTGFTDSGVPTFDAVRERIETRAGTADGARELDATTPAGRTLDEQYAAREKAAQERLDEIRRSLRRD
ncbi:hypothetical protein ACFYVR_20950 [Rhodococcus sp. NPDC003318]|uniref:hypothetical protein n=1 Tax=Rhodococcus sp. NPDC003318 TaxID=3364503 RepID=UPI0036ACAD4D